jgi:tryptophanyl-tRNA synthetase
MADPQRLEDILQAGATRARAIAAPLLAELREAVGLRRFAGVADTSMPVKAGREALPQVKQYREADGRFYFKLLSAEGDLLLQSDGYATAKEAGQDLQRLRQCSALELREALGGRVTEAAQDRIAVAFGQLQSAEAERKARAQAG